MLPASALRAHRVDFQIRVIDFDVHVLRLRKHGDGGGGCVDAPLRFSVGNALDAVNARLEFHFREDAASDDLRDDFLVAPRSAVADRKDFQLPAVRFGVALIHSEKVASKERGFIAASAGAHFKNGSALVSGILGQQGDPYGLLKRCDAGARLAGLLLREAAHFCVGCGIFKHGFNARELIVGAAPGADGFDDNAQL